MVATGLLGAGAVAACLVVTHRQPTWHLDSPTSTVTLDSGHYDVASTIAHCASGTVRLWTEGQRAPLGSPTTEPMYGWASYGVDIYGGGTAQAHPAPTHTSFNVVGRSLFTLQWAGSTPSGCAVDVTISRS
jgi:hypothetical protein